MHTHAHMHTPTQKPYIFSICLLNTIAPGKDQKRQWGNLRHWDMLRSNILPGVLTSPAGDKELTCLNYSQGSSAGRLSQQDPPPPPIEGLLQWNFCGMGWGIWSCDQGICSGCFFQGQAVARAVCRSFTEPLLSLGLCECHYHSLTSSHPHHHSS